MTEIEVQIDWRRLQPRRVHQRLLRRFHGWWFTPALFGFAVVAWASLTWLMRPSSLDDWVASIFPFTVAALATYSLRDIADRRLNRTVQASEYRQPAPFVLLNAMGVHSPPGGRNWSIPWRLVSDVFETAEGVFLLMTPVDFVPLPDAGLPERLTRADLKARIQTWRETAA